MLSKETLGSLGYRDWCVWVQGILTAEVVALFVLVVYSFFFNLLISHPGTPWLPVSCFRNWSPANHRATFSSSSAHLSPCLLYMATPKILQHEIYVVHLCRSSLFHDVILWCIKSFICWSFFLGSSAVFTRHCPQTSRDMPGDSHWSFNKSSRMFTLQSCSGFDPTKSCGMKIKRCKFFPSESSWNVHVVWAIEIVRDSWELIDRLARGQIILETLKATDVFASQK